MICPDCELSVIRLTSNNRCFNCDRRASSITYRNKVNNKDDIYIPIKELKNINPIEYNRSMGRRIAKFNKEHPDNTLTLEDVKNGLVKDIYDTKEPIKSNKTKKSIDKTKDINALRNKYYSVVAKDLNTAFDDAKLSLDYLSNKNLDSWVETLYCLVQEDNFITDAKKAEQIYNNLKNTYNHALESLSWDSIDEITNVNFSLKALSELRRPTKELLDFYNVIGPLIEYLKQDSNFMSILSDIRIKVLQKSDNHENPVYYSSIESNVTKNIDNIVTDKSNIKRVKLYDCTVYCYNLNGDINRRLFRMNNGLYAKNFTDAKLNFKRFLSEKFSNVTYRDQDISIEEVDSIDTIKKRILSDHKYINK
jgi:hypothetical protein